MSGKRHETPRSDPPAATGAAPSLEESPDPGANSPISINLISLGCPKNLVDSEMILGNAGLAGFRITPSAEDADVIVINTCGFIDQAREESVNTILEACEVKRQSSTPKKVYIYGALDLGPTVLNRAFGLTWDLAGWLLTPFMAKAGPEIVGRMRARVMDNITTTFASHYKARVPLKDILTREAVLEYNARRTGEKYLILPNG